MRSARLFRPTRRLAKWLCSVGAILSFGAARAETFEVLRSHSRLVEVPFDVASIAVGESDIARATAVTPRRVLINAAKFGATSLMYFGRKGELESHLVHVVHNTDALRAQLMMIDPRIKVASDPNRNAIVISGLVRTEQLKRRALETALSFVGNTRYTVLDMPLVLSRDDDASVEDISTDVGPANVLAQTPGSTRQRTPAGGRPMQARLPLNTESVISAVRTTDANAPQIIDLLASDESFVAPHGQLRQMLAAIDASLRVTEVNTVLHVTGKVDTPIQLTRALTLIDSYVGVGTASGDFRPVSDRGGVLVANNSNVGSGGQGGEGGNRRSQSSAFGGGSSSGFSSSNRGSAGSAGIAISESPAKGNIALNLSRSSAVSIAGGRALSLIEVRDQPRVEVQVRIVAVDRDATDKLGFNWRLDGSHVSIGNLTGGVVDTLPSASGSSTNIGGGGSGGSGAGNNNAIDVGTANIVGFFRSNRVSISAFLQAIEEKGAGTALSEPLLTAVSGEIVRFLVGGEIPIPVANTSISTNSAVGGSTTTNQNTLEFREFGIQLFLRPTVLEDGRISLVLDQSITQPDYSRSFLSGGNQVPSFSKRAVQTITESADGETWAVAGLLTQEDSDRLEKVPLIGNVPILGKLFQSSNKRRARSELIITITARKVPLPAPVTAAREVR